MSTSTNLSNYATYVQFMLMTPMSCKTLRGLAIGYEYTTDTDTSNILRHMTAKYLHLAGKMNDEIFNITQWMPPNVKIQTKLQLASPNFILRKVFATATDGTIYLTLAMLHLQK